MTLMQLTLETAIKEAGELEDVRISKEDALYILSILKKYETINETIQIKEPECCKNCKSMEQLNETGWYCHMNSILPENQQTDISTASVNPDEKPSWCPITKINDQISKLDLAKRENVNMLMKGLSVLFENEHMLDFTK